jgi:hypothetical protein
MYPTKPENKAFNFKKKKNVAVTEPVGVAVKL